MITKLILIILSTIVISYFIGYYVTILLSRKFNKKRKQLNNELLPTITKPDVQSLFSKNKDKKKKEREIVFFKNSPKNYGEYLQQTGKQKWAKK